MVSKPKFPRPPPSELVETIVEGLVSHIETPFFWLQRDPDAVADLCSGDVGEQQTGHVVGVGDCVAGRWDGDWCRGEVVEENDSEVVVKFIDWGNTEVLARSEVRKSDEREIVKEIGALKCRIIDVKEERWEEELQITDYMVKLRCVAVYDNVFLMKKNVLELNLPLSEDIPCELAEISGDHKSAWFHPTSLQDSLDSLMDQLDTLASSLSPMSASDVFSGQLCGAKFSEDEVMYRAKVISVKEDIVEVIYIDYGNSESRSLSDLYVLPDEILSPNPHAVKMELDGYEKFSLESVKVVKLSDVNGRILAKVDSDVVEKSEEVKKFFHQKVIKEEKLPLSQKIPVSVGHVESVNMVWVTPIGKVEGMDVNDEMITQIEDKLALYQSNPQLLKPKLNIDEGDVGITTFTEDACMYRFRLEDGNMVRFVDYGNMEQKAEKDLFELPEELTKYPAGVVSVTIDHGTVVENTEDNIGVIDEKLNIENLYLVMEEDKATFYQQEQRVIFFQDEKIRSKEDNINEIENHENLSSKKGNIIEIDVDDDDAPEDIPTKIGYGWNVGDEVTYMRDRTWSKGIIASLVEDTATVQGGSGGSHKVEYRNLKSPGMPVDALNQVEVELSITTNESDLGDMISSDPKPTFMFSKSQVLKYEVQNNDEVDKARSSDNNVQTPVKLSTTSLTKPSLENETNPAKILPRKADTRTFDLSPSCKATKKDNTGALTLKKKAPAKFKPTKDITQKMMDDWIAGCLKMLEQSKLKECSPKNGFIKSVEEKVNIDENMAKNNSEGKDVLTENKEILKDVISEAEPHTDVIVKLERSSSDVSTEHVSPLTQEVYDELAKVDVSNKDGRQKVLDMIFKSDKEDKVVLLSLVKNKLGVSVLQKIMPMWERRTIFAVVRSLQGVVVEVASDPLGCVFLQDFFRLFFKREMVDLLLEEVMDNLNILAFDDIGTWLVQDVIKFEDKQEFDKPCSSYLIRVAYWLVKNIETVLVNAASASLARTVVQMVMLKNISGQTSTHSQILENMIRVMLDTNVKHDGEILPLLILAAEHPHGHNVVMEMVSKRACLLLDNSRMVEMLNQHKAKLEIGTFGCLVVKGMRGFL